jgi:hypothetical protein
MATDPIGHKNAQKTTWASALIARAPIGATYGTPLAFDSSDSGMVYCSGAL